MILAVDRSDPILSTKGSLIIGIDQERQSRGRECVAPPQMETPENPLKDSLRTFSGGITALRGFGRGIRLSRGRSGVSRLITN